MLNKDNKISKETILKLYQEWKIQNDKFTKDQVKKFIGGDTNE